MTNSSTSTLDSLEDVSFLLPFSFDCAQRLENLRVVATWIRTHFEGPILIGGHDLQLIEQRGDMPSIELVPVDRGPYDDWWSAPVRNALSEAATTELIALWDVDVCCAPDQIREAARMLRGDDVHF